MNHSDQDDFDNTPRASLQPARPLPARPVSPYRKRRWLGPVVALCLILAAALLAYRLFKPAQPRTAAPARLSLKVERTEGALRLVWDANSPILQNVQQGVLRVTDGSGLRRIELNQQQLHNGSVVCFPSGDDVKFELEVPFRGRPYTESVQVLMLGGVPGQPTQGRPSALSAPVAEVPPAAAAESAPKPATVASRTAVQAPKTTPTIRPFTPPDTTASRSAAQPVEELPPPPVVHQRAASLPPPVPARRLAYTATATCEPVKASRFRRVIGKVPGFRRLQRAPQTDEDYVPPKAARPITFTLPPDASPRLMQKKQMDLKASVDEKGRVTRVELLAIPDEELVKLASYAASEWHFQPARLDDKPIASEVILHFKFNGN